MSLTYADSRLAPLGNTFLVDEKPRAQRRSRSYSGYVPYHQWRSGGASQVAAECVCVDSDASTCAESICGKSTPELWPDTDSDVEEHVRLSCSRGHALAPVPTGAGPGGDFRAPSRIVATALSGSPQFPVVPSPCWFGSQVSRSAVNLSFAMRAAEVALAALEEAEAAGEETAAVANKETSTAAGGGNAARVSPQARKDNMGKRRTTGKQDKANLEDTLPKGVTSLMLHGIPSEMNQRWLLEEINRDFAGRCDFCYMPCDFISGKNRGQAFVNFTSHGAAVEFHSAWHKRPTSTGHVLSISVAAQQGLAAQMAIWSCPRLRRVRNPNFRPFVLGGAHTA